MPNKTRKEETTAVEWLSFWESIDPTNRMTVAIGFIVLMFFVLLLGYFGTKTFVKSFDYYQMTFSAPFVEDIRPGTKIRYQGALEIGEVIALKSSTEGHRVTAKIRDDFRIPQIGSRASLSSWGYFGSKFINIEVIPDSGHDFYTLKSRAMPLEKIINSSILFQQYYDIIKKDGVKMSLLERRLQDLKKAITEVRNIPYAQRHIARRMVHQTANMMQDFFGVINTTSQDLYVMLSRLNDISDYLVYDLNRNLPKIRASMKKLEQSVAYESNSFSARLLHEEGLYLTLLDYTKFANEKLDEMAASPYRIFFNK